MLRRTIIGSAVAAALGVALPASAAPPHAGVNAATQQQRTAAAAAKVDGDRSLAVRRDADLARAKSQHALQGMREARRAQGFDRDRDDRLALHHARRIDRDDAMRRDRDDLARRDRRPDRDQHFAAERREARAFPSREAQVNSNGWFTADRDYGLARAEDRHELNAARDASRAGRLDRDDRFRASGASQAASAERDSRAGPHFVNALGAPRDRTADRDDLTSAR